MISSAEEQLSVLLASRQSANNLAFDRLRCGHAWCVLPAFRFGYSSESRQNRRWVNSVPLTHICLHPLHHLPKSVNLLYCIKMHRSDTHHQVYPERSEGPLSSNPSRSVTAKA